MTLEQVVKTLKEDYGMPDNVFIRYGNNFKVKERVVENTLEYVREWFWIEKIGGCGCGSPDAVQDEIQKCLLFAKNMPDEDDAWKKYLGIESVYDDPMRMFMLYILDDKGLIEHGTSINVPWITKLGELYLWVLEQEGGDA